MEIPEEVRDEVVRLQGLQQKMQSLLVQKQNIQVQMVEINNALKELGKQKSGEDVFEIVGAIMLKKDVTELKKSLAERKEIFELRSTSYDKQIKTINADLSKLQESIAGKLKGKGGK